MSGYFDQRNGQWVNLDDIFEPRESGDGKVPNVGFEIGGVDISNRYAPLSVGSASGGPIGMHGSDGVDIGHLFCGKGFRDVGTLVNITIGRRKDTYYSGGIDPGPLPNHKNEYTGGGSTGGSAVEYYVYGYIHDSLNRWGGVNPQYIGTHQITRIAYSDHPIAKTFSIIIRGVGEDFLESITLPSGADIYPTATYYEAKDGTCEWAFDSQRGTFLNTTLGAVRSITLNHI